MGRTQTLVEQPSPARSSHTRATAFPPGSQVDCGGKLLDPRVEQLRIDGVTGNDHGALVAFGLVADALRLLRTARPPGQERQWTSDRYGPLYS
jgi:hypothetical protein